MLILRRSNCINRASGIVVPTGFITPDSCNILMQFCFVLLLLICLFCLFSIINFYVSLTVHLSITLENDQLDAQVFNTFITILYMFRAISCLTSGGQIVLIQHLVLSIPDAVLIQFDLLRMSKILLETCTCRGS